MIRRILTNTRKHILRSGWVGWASVFVMTLAFLVASIFGGMAMVANLYIQYIESKSNMLVFFNVGTDPEIVNRLRTEWETDPKISEIVYMSEEQAFDFYSAYTSRVVPEQYRVLTRFDEKKLPSSLEIKINSLNDISDVQNRLQKDIDAELAKLIIVDINDSETPVDETAPAETDTAADQPAEETTTETTDQTATDESTTDTTAESDSISLGSSSNESEIRYKYSDEPGDKPIQLLIDNENLETLKDVFFTARMIGLGTLSLLFVFVSIFIFMTVEFRLYNQKEEIGVMQLVGGSLMFIRAPYILEGGFYGMLGSLLSSAIIGGILYFIFIINAGSTLTKYLYNNFGQLPWPDLNNVGLAALVAGLAAVGFFLGAMSSYFSIRRYIR
ncbi:permease-like cell division protein FtsX [Candidatus Dojkabacteria bacterium]|uniref:Cell division protein FtsX n=1 Tax=Candidatus Dojkabacteria bacterium TaxID=2099670 RepID=A0A955L1U0_9BACT|nr:permease-like cell division protein FtsX [Candidatus Dojkabacteria bacterium]